MTKLIGVILAAMVILSSANAASRRFAKYKRIEAYEIRPGVLMMPNYSADGNICDIGLEVLHYSPKLIRLDSELSRKEINQIFHELVPAEESGPKSKDLPGDLIVQDGFGSTEFIEYKNVVLEIDSRVAPDVGQGEGPVRDLVAEIKWKHRKCR